MTSAAGALWKKVLQKEGYEHHVFSLREVKKLKNFSRVFRRIFKTIGLNSRVKPGRVFDFGFGGGIHLVQFALNNWECAGIDVSEEVLKRAQNFIAEIEQVSGVRLKIKLLAGDFFEYLPSGNEQFDIVYQVGVIEHFLDDGERLKALQKMFEITKPRGFVLSIVPSGMHPLRQLMKEKNLGGYDIPEIDYTPELMADELEKCGGRKIAVLPHNLGGYLRMQPGLIYKIIFYLLQLIPLDWLPRKIAFRHCGSFIGIAQK